MPKKWYFHRFKKIRGQFLSAMQRFVFFIFLLSLINAETSFSQSAGKAIAKGKVLDSLSAEPLGFASIRIFDAKDSKLVNGNITTESGDFSIDLPYGRYYAEVEFMGYNAVTTSAFTLSDQHAAHDFGIIGLSASVSTLDEVVVQAEKSSIELSLDKKIFNVFEVCIVRHRECRDPGPGVDQAIQLRKLPHAHVMPCHNRQQLQLHLDCFDFFLRLRHKQRIRNVRNLLPQFKAGATLVCWN